MTPRALKEWRQGQRISQKAFARWLGVSRSTVNRWEGGLQAIPHMLGLLAQEHAARRDSFDTECGCIAGIQACSYHAAGFGGRWLKQEADERAWFARGKEEAAEIARSGPYFYTDSPGDRR